MLHILYHQLFVQSFPITSNLIVLTFHFQVSNFSLHSKIWPNLCKIAGSNLQILLADFVVEVSTLFVVLTPSFVALKKELDN